MKVLAAVAILLLALAIPGINVYHHIELPTINKYRIVQTYFVNFSYPFIHTRTDITLEEEIRGQVLYEDVYKILQQAESGDTVFFHLGGIGGQVDTGLRIINNIKASKAYVTMVVDAPVYSGDAYLALSGNAIQVRPYVLLMFHYSSVLNVDCSKMQGNDRGVSNVEHCNMFKDANTKLFQTYLDSLPILTSQEKQQLRSGHDVYLYGSDINARIKQ